MIDCHGDFTGKEGSNLLASFQNTAHKLSDFVLSIRGMSSKKYRIFINNLIENTPDARYLEVGTWAGSTVCSAMYKNRLKVTCIDNWSQFGGPKDQFIANTEKVLGESEHVDFAFIEDDFRNVDFRQMGSFNVYLFDGPHAEQDHYDGIINVQAALDDTYVLIVDDWNGDEVREGTTRALSEKANVICSIAIRTPAEYSDWHNGYFFCVCQKKRSITEMLK